MKVRALKDGFHGGSFHRVNAEFDVADDEKASWFEPVDGKAQQGGKGQTGEAPKGGKGQTTLNQMANAKPRTMTQVMADGKGDNRA
jgi:hypothetical protein